MLSEHKDLGALGRKKIRFLCCAPQLTISVIAILGFPQRIRESETRGSQIQSDKPATIFGRIFFGPKLFLSLMYGRRERQRAISGASKVENRLRRKIRKA